MNNAGDGKNEVSVMKQIQKRMLLQVILGFVLGRVVVFGINPVGAAYFAAGFTERGAVLPVAVTVLLGMSTVLPLESVVIYGASMLALWLTADLLKYRHIEIRMGHAALIMAGSNFILSWTKLLLFPYTTQNIWYYFLEAILILAATRILYEGVCYLLHGTSDRMPDREETISLILMVGMGLLGLPHASLAALSVTEIAVYAILLSLGYLVGTRGQDYQKNGQMREILKFKLKDFSESFRKLSRALSEQTDKQFQMTHHEMREMMDQIASQVCERCEHREHCMGQLELSRSEIFGMLALAQEQGELDVEQMPARFLQECIHLERFITETNQNLQMTRMMMGVRNKMTENRQVMAGQMEEVGRLVEGLAEQVEGMEEIPADAESRIVRRLLAKRVQATGIMFYEKRDGRLEIHMRAKTQRGRLVTAREVAGVLREVLGKPIRLSEDSRQIISREMSYYVYEEDTPLRAITSVARRPKEGEEISGDVFSCLSLPGGETLVALSDGMGSGQKAFEESRTVIELLEQMAEAGFSEMSALKLINSVFLCCEETEHYVTADILILNLYQGSCQFIKNGATATYLYRRGETKRIEGQALPIGVRQEMTSFTGNADIMDGDYVIMMTDGIADCFQDTMGSLEEYLSECDVREPDELADAILEEALARQNGYAGDDMSVIVTEIQKR